MRGRKASGLRRIVPFVLVLGTAPVAARAGCTGSDLLREDARAAAVRPGAGRTYFVQDATLVPGCPREGAACRSRALLTPGDVVLTAASRGAFTCAGFVSAKGVTTTGWLPTAALAPLPDTEQRPTDAVDHWTGRWVAPEQRITVTPGRDGALLVQGDATWGARDPERLRRGSVRTGEVEGEARPRDGLLRFSTGPDGATLPFDAGEESDCRLSLWRRGPYLLVQDNNACGGVNVTFSGFYRRGG